MLTKSTVDSFRSSYNSDDGNNLIIKNDIGPDPMYGEHCMDDQYRTTNGGGNFNPRKQCDKQFHGHEKDQCCGRYPNRYPYDEDFKECCQTGTNFFFQNFLSYIFKSLKIFN